MKKILSLALIFTLLNSSNIFTFSSTKDCFYPSTNKYRAIQKSNQRNERKGSTNGSLK